MRAAVLRDVDGDTVAALVAFARCALTSADSAFAAPGADATYI